MANSHGLPTTKSDQGEPD